MRERLTTYGVKTVKMFYKFVFLVTRPNDASSCMIVRKKSKTIVDF